MITQRTLRYQKKKIIGGNLLKNVYDRVKGILATGSKIAVPLAKKAIANLSKSPELTEKSTAIPAGLALPLANKAIASIPELTDRSRAILSNLIAGSGFKNYINQ